MINRFGAILVFALDPVDRETVDTRFAYKLPIFALHARLVESQGSTAAGALILFIGIALVGQHPVIFVTGATTLLVA